MPNLEHMNFVQHVCTRPQLYTPNGTLTEMISFLSGYYEGVRPPDGIFRPDHQPTANCDAVRQTLEWIMSHSNTPDSEVNRLSPSRISVHELLTEYSSEQLAIDAIFEYASSLNETNADDSD